MQQNIVFVGAGGAGVSSLVLLFQSLGLPNIVAIDSTESELTKKLRQAGIQVIIGHGTYEVQQDDIIIYSDAAEHSPEVQAAHDKTLNNRKRVFPPMSYFQFLGELSKYLCTISIAGTHGKSTTTALTATALHTHHPDFGLGIVGAPIKQRCQKNFIVGDDRHQDIKAIIEHILFPKGPDISSLMKKYLFVIEADEYNHHFLHLDTDYACITNIELDHADIYGTFDNYLDTFLTFARRVRYDIFVLPDALGMKDFMNHVRLPRETPQSVRTHREAPVQTFSFTHLLGSHNHANASLALTCTVHLCKQVRAHRDAPLHVATEKDIKQTLETFKGLRRRGELLTINMHGVPIITDYGHHPSELASTLVALREKHKLPSGDKVNAKGRESTLGGRGAGGDCLPLTCIFQPHQARRVMEFRESFTHTLQEFDTTIIYDIYAARENLDDLKQQFKHDKQTDVPPDKGVDASERSEDTSGGLFDNVHSIDDLGTRFAESCGGRYTTHFADIKKTLDETNEGVIIIFTAGNLDWKVRKHISSTIEAPKKLH